ncbi:MAG: DUF4416 family protein [Desulfobacteraceae bacterium]|nr:MAG: DUF4416 family protein [Desulfobacteraceae bacterium]
MSIPKHPDPAKLVVSILTSDRMLVKPVLEKIEQISSPVDLISPWMAFDYTNYYQKEMGTPLFRRMAGFSALIHQGDLCRIKLQTNTIENEFLKGGNRRVNIDPGYLLPSRFILATGKDFAHRVFIGDNIYADLTLIYQKQGFKTLAWTYPDYASEPVLKFLGQVRSKYVLDLKQENAST